MIIRPVKREEVDEVGKLWFELVTYHREVVGYDANSGRRWCRALCCADSLEC